MTDCATIREARPDEAEQLSGLALRSKGHWGYSQEFLELCRDELTIRADQIDDEKFDVVVAERNDEIAGFFALQRESPRTFELHALFVEPKHIGSGIGRDLVRHALQLVAAKSGTRLTIQGDPNADRFYKAAGARQIGSRESGSVPGRFLPLFEIRVQESQ